MNEPPATATPHKSCHDFYDFVRNDLPKVELHAHLNGCIPIDVLHQLADDRRVTLPTRLFGSRSRRQNGDSTDLSRATAATSTSSAISTTAKTSIPTTNKSSSIPPDMYNRHPRSLQDCFDMFAVLPLVVTDLGALRVITRSALQQFANHHTVYVELRSTPKRLHREFQSQEDHSPSEQPMASKLDYIRTIVEEIHTLEQNEQERYMRECKSWEQQQHSGTLNHDHVTTGILTKQKPPRLPIMCRLLLSVDRAQSTEEARDTVELAIHIRKGHYDQTNACGIPTVSRTNVDLHSTFSCLPLLSKYVVGLDLGGNPTKQSFTTFAPLFIWARQQMSMSRIADTTANHNTGTLNGGDELLYITIHGGEIPCDTVESEAYQEAEAILDFGPDRIGHAVLWPPALLKRLSASKIPVETCPTSNVMTLELHHSTTPVVPTTSSKGSTGNRGVGNLVHGLLQHTALARWMETNHPLATCTDDPGVFDTSPTQELWLLATTFDLTLERLVDMVIESMSYAFCDSESKGRVQHAMRHHVNLVLAMVNDKLRHTSFIEP